MAGVSELYGVVVAGRMNPAIHHPAWYESTGILTLEEARAALDSPETASTPFLSVFRTSGMSVQCSQERWEIQTPEVDKVDRILEVASRVFEVLTHTPVSAFGLNFHFLRPTSLRDVGKRLAELVNSLPLGRAGAEGDTAQVTVTSTQPRRTIQEVISGAPGSPGVVQIAFNVHHPIASAPPGTHFDLGPLLRDAHRDDYSECLGKVDRVVKSLGEVRKE